MSLKIHELIPLNNVCSLDLYLFYCSNLSILFSTTKAGYVRTHLKTENSYLLIKNCLFFFILFANIDNICMITQRQPMLLLFAEKD